MKRINMTLSGDGYYAKIEVRVYATGAAFQRAIGLDYWGAAKVTICMKSECRIDLRPSATLKDIAWACYYIGFRCGETDPARSELCSLAAEKIWNRLVKWREAKA